VAVFEHDAKLKYFRGERRNKDSKETKKKKEKKTRRESGKTKTDLFEKKPIGFGFGLGFPQGSTIF
jgi:hypothetical protein